jgi:hypothetical protein
MAKSSIYLHFSPEFPADLANALIELDPAEKGTIKTDSYWTFGTLPTNDISLKPPQNKEEMKHYSSVSRLHLTVKWDSRVKNFYVLDGGVYPDEKDTSPGGKPLIKPSRNGIWIDGYKATFGDWELITPGSHIYLGNGKKIVVRGSEHDTLNDEIWDQLNWQIKGEKEKGSLPVKENLELAKHSKENALPPETPWGLIGRVFDWFVAPGKTRSENVMKIFLLGLGIAIATSDKVNFIINWIFRRN